jgi:hypothetical protein
MAAQHGVRVFRDDHAPEGRFLIQGPTPDSPVVQAWADDYIRFENLPAWQKSLREEIRGRCGKLKPLTGQLLHTTFCGPKRPRADVENLVLYNIGSFPVAGCNGIRFEYGATVPPAPDGGEYRFGYCYALEVEMSPLKHWSQGRPLASFGWTEVEGFKSDKPLAPVWLAVCRGGAKQGLPAIAPDSVFGVRVEVRPPYGRRAVWGGVVKGIVDGVICAFHGHTDTTVLPDVVARLSKILPAQPEEIDSYLRRKDRAVLGEVYRLVAPYRSGVKWDPADHLCVAGEVIAAPAEPGDAHWAIKGEIFELSRE